MPAVDSMDRAYRNCTAALGCLWVQISTRETTVPLLHATTNEPTSPQSSPFPLDLHTITTTLTVYTRMHPLLTRSRLQTKADLRLAAWATGTPLPLSSSITSWLASQQLDDAEPAALQAALGLDFASKPWHAIYSLNNPDIIGGWGSFEMLRLKDTVVQALHVSAAKGVPAALAFGKVGLSHEVWNVLFVEEVNVGGGQYRRVGVGKIFDTEMVEEIRAVKERRVEIV